ncbi:DUF308 domain-containing protein [Paenibacillus sp. LHD-38]|uniref:DUF308 domain-containing protein n=1 Tax=Paenibacillus sp. LHD-38 TaxID=3072143 RepID=UPI0028101E40|nr:DUF308 domain-containing protein [Paenibacillus sp. LHD-38]MDQ8737126.1 DUF308 domain-containing protein [Paenibacillus sp. LHD-38]
MNVSRKTAILAFSTGSVSVILIYCVALLTEDVGQTLTVLIGAWLVTLGIIALVNTFKDWKETRFQFNAPLLGMGTLYLLLAVTLVITQLT